MPKNPQAPQDPLELLRQTMADDQIILKHLRGGKIEPQKVILQRCERYYQDPFHFSLGSVGLPEHALFQGVAYIGSSGSGKSLGINQVKRNRLSHVGKGHRHRAFIWDFKGRERWYVDPLDLDCPVYYVNPIDERGVGIDLAAELTGPLEADAFAADVIMPIPGKDGGESNATFQLAAQAVFAEVIKVFQEMAPGNWQLIDVLEACRSEKMLRRILPVTADGEAFVEDLFGANRQAKGIMLTLRATINRLFPLAAAMAHSENISLREWVQGPEEAVLILQNVPKYEANLAPLFRWVFKHTLSLVMSRYEDRGETYTFFIDEARWAPFADELTKLATAGREYRAGFVLGFQDVQGLENVLNPNGVGELFSCCSTQVWFQNNNPATARFASERFGQQLLLTADLSISDGSSTSTNAEGLTEDQKYDINHRYYAQKRQAAEEQRRREAKADGRSYASPSTAGWGDSSNFELLPADEQAFLRGISPSGAPISESSATNRNRQASLRTAEQPTVYPAELIDLEKPNPFGSSGEDLTTFAVVASTYLGNWMEITNDMMSATIKPDKSIPVFRPRPDSELRFNGWTDEDEERLHVLPPEEAASRPNEED